MGYVHGSQNTIGRKSKDAVPAVVSGGSVGTLEGISVKAIRLDKSGQVDDVAISCDMFRLERMDECVWWAAAYVGDQRVTFSIFMKEGRVEVEVVEDEIGCKDDVKEEENGKEA
jgi:hypothetical protein